jgi:hypothetical protein
MDQTRSPPEPNELEQSASLERLGKQLQGVTYLLNLAVTSIAQLNKARANSKENWVGLDADIDCEKEVERLVGEDAKLGDLLLAKLPPDEECFHQGLLVDLAGCLFFLQAVRVKL